MESLKVFACDIVYVGQQHKVMPKRFVLIKRFREIVSMANLAFVGSNISSRPPTVSFNLYKLQQAYLGLLFNSLIRKEKYVVSKYKISSSR
jgi:hypothetical protein